MHTRSWAKWWCHWHCKIFNRSAGNAFERDLSLCFGNQRKIYIYHKCRIQGFESNVTPLSLHSLCWTFHGMVLLSTWNSQLDSTWLDLTRFQMKCASHAMTIKINKYTPEKKRTYLDRHCMCPRYPLSYVVVNVFISCWASFVGNFRQLFTMWQLSYGNGIV